MVAEEAVCDGQGRCGAGYLEVGYGVMWIYHCAVHGRVSGVSLEYYSNII